MDRVTKVIENPEVPGLECLLPPPPPPPPPPVISAAGIEQQKIASISAMPENRLDGAITERKVKSKIDLAERDRNEKDGIPISAKSDENIVQPFPAGEIPTYFAQSAVEQLSSVEEPWWVPTESDAVDLMPQNTSWINGNPVAWTDPSHQKNISPSSRAKGKFLKRKSECIDPAQDAERVANAQRELSGLMTPLKCNLCNAIMNSTLQAKLHYDGKPHQKKVSMFLNQSVKKIKPDDGHVTSTTSSADWNTYCEVCKTWFTSQIDASQHYAGKKHIRATTGTTRQKTKKPQAVRAAIDPTGRFGIGVPFSSDVSITIPEAVDPPLIPPVPSPVISPINNYQTPVWPFPTFRCDLCGITANRPEQLETHKRGARHTKMLRMTGVPNPDSDEINDDVTQPAPSTIDYSIYRTPSGQYYCAPCNRSFHSENSFAQHIDSEKHKTRINPKQPVPAPPTPVKKPNKSSK